MDRCSHEGLTNGARCIVLDGYCDNVGWAEGLIPPSDKAGKPPYRDVSLGRVGFDVVQELSWHGFRAVIVGGGYGHELETCHRGLVQDLDGVSGISRGGSRGDWLEGPDYGSAHEVSDRAMEAEYEVVPSRPLCSHNRVDVEGRHSLIR